jgi:hypothetical protein
VLQLPAAVRARCRGEATFTFVLPVKARLPQYDREKWIGPAPLLDADGVHPAMIDPMAIPSAASNRPRHRTLTMVLPHFFVRRLAEMADWPDEDSTY